MFSKEGGLGEGNTKVNNLFIEDVFQGGCNGGGPQKLIISL